MRKELLCMTAENIEPLPATSVTPHASFRQGFML